MLASAEYTKAQTDLGHSYVAVLSFGPSGTWPAGQRSTFSLRDGVGVLWAWDEEEHKPKHEEDGGPRVDARHGSNGCHSLKHRKGSSPATQCG